MRQKLLGLIAGNGKFPLLFAHKARMAKYKVVAAAVKGDTSFFLRFFVDKIKWFKAGQLRALFSFLKEEEVKDVIMAGQVSPANLFDKHLVLDEEFKELFNAIKDRKADTIFSAVADKLKQQGMELRDSTFLLKDSLAPHGTLTRRAPDLRELDDIVFGKEIAKAMGGLDVGQTVVVKERAIVAIEAMEGTDAAILRGGRIAREGAVVVKMSKPEQDFRFDVPVIGDRTIKNMIRANASCLAIEAGKTIIIAREKVISLANKADICIVGT